VNEIPGAVPSDAEAALADERRSIVGTRHPLDVERPIPNRAERRRMAGTDSPTLPSLDDARMIGFLTRVRVRSVARSRVMSAAMAELARQAETGDAE
jgi:hypothetical protein